ncbi:DNA-binding transcriptional regulator, AcrR family [Amycolatopsis tolypomycina]|uniref:DNA-binding transcriptional regulator, AcrR family n=1 Tax=Amycolatopsis tolypomycina TaxID=208445 RepID=A0A1H4X1V8_9PSEU|nr:TetR family transcriptional regulator [Amycolatopsis tolypomycina]SEC98831.1 DNA-binding transcriptional regulator, AcrR family [Amycolatopsis tolypomycina]
MPRKAGRSPEETRRALLDAAATVIRTRGVSASLDDIARAAGVSKGGLLYHFPAKDALVRTLAQDLLDTFRTDVQAAIDPADTEPGRLTRAYVRASLDTSYDEVAIRQTIALVAQLISIPEIAELARADAERWERDLHADGLPPELVTLVVAAADGACTAPLWGAGIDVPAMRKLEQQLLALTRTA